MAKYDFLFRFIELPFISSIIFWPVVTGGDVLDISSIEAQDAIFGVFFAFFAAILIITDPGGHIFKYIVNKRYKLSRVVNYLIGKKEKKINKKELNILRTQLKDLRKQLEEKQDELFAAQNNPQISQEHVEKLENQIYRLVRILTPIEKEIFYVYHEIPPIIQYILSLKYIRHGLQTKAIDIEIDKLVAVGYFFSVVLAVNVSIFNPIFAIGFYNNVIVSMDPLISSLPWCANMMCTNGLNGHMWIIQMLLIPIHIIILIALFNNTKSFFRKVRTVSIYILSVNNGHFQKAITKHLKEAIENRQWETAESLSHRYVDSLDVDSKDLDPFDFK